MPARLSGAIETRRKHEDIFKLTQHNEIRYINEKQRNLVYIMCKCNDKKLNA